MKKLLLAVTIMALVASFGVTASASSTLYDFTFRDTSGSPYCDGLYFYNYNSYPYPKALVDGFHWNTFCSGTSYVNGFKAGVSYGYQYSGTGAVFVISDPDLGNGSGGGTGIVWLVNPVYKHWILWYSGGGAGEYVVNYGTFVNFTRADAKGSTLSSQKR